MKTLSAIAVSLLVSVVPASAQTVSDLMAKMREQWMKPAEPFKIIDNVYYVGTEGLASFLVTSPNGHMLVNSALPEATPLIKANIDKLGFKLTDIKYLISTEAHYDHAGGWAELKKETGAQLVASAGDKPLLEGGYYPGQEQTEALKFPSVKVDRVVADGDKITIPDTVGKGRAKRDLTLVAHLTPGHTPGCISWTTVTREQKWNHNVIFFCSLSIAANRLVGENLTYPTIVDDYKKTFVIAKGLIADVFLAPHPEMFKMADKVPLVGKYGVNPFIKAGEFHTYVRDAEKTFDEGLAKQKAAADAGK
jgi:metallo-beta-lactamase class B